MTLAKKQVLTAYVFLAVPLLFFLFVRFVPMAYALVMGTTNWRLLARGLRFVGWDNFGTIFGDKVFLASLGNTLRYALVGAPLTILISFFLALQLSAVTRLRSLYRLLYVLPYITPVVAVSWVWRWMYQPVPLGIINGLLTSAGLAPHGFLIDPGEALASITAVNVWVELGYCVTIFLAGIQSIPEELLEAARMDGASQARVLRSIILPLLLPVTLFLTVMQGIQFLRIFTQVYNMSNQATGGPLDSTKSIALYVYQAAFTRFDMGVAASASLVLFAIILAVTLLQIRFFDRKIAY
jgi:multiple sugar transport system permease protein